jgi:hypothetical protein
MSLVAEQNADPVAMQYLTGVLTRAESGAYVQRAQRHFVENGWGQGYATEAAAVAIMRYAPKRGLGKNNRQRALPLRIWRVTYVDLYVLT